MKIMKKLITLFFFFLSILIFAQTDSVDSKVTFHFQQTFVNQYHPSFRSNVSYLGQKTLNNSEENTLSTISTLYVGAKLWKNGEGYFNPEVAGGSGFSGATGVAGFPNGTTFRVGSPAPSLYIARLFFRQIIPLRKEKIYREEDINILGRTVPAERIIITFGKFSLSDIFDQNVTSHDPMSSLLNWSLMDAGAWDYPSNTRGYTWATSVKVVKKKYIFRFCTAVNALWSNGLVTENGVIPTPQNYANAHGETYEIILPLKSDFSNTLKFTAFMNHGRMASYSDATKSLNSDTSISNRNIIGSPVSLGDTSSHLVSPALDKLRGKSGSYYGKYGFVVNWEMKLGHKKEMVFIRASWNDGKNESWMYTEIDQSISFGGFLSGIRFHRPTDMIRVGIAINGISNDHATYLRAGGYGFIIGDGKGNYPKGISSEYLIELQYNYHVSFMTLSPDYQFIINPAYNPARGPVNVFGLRAHVEI
jgi:high affinity Mn2+ porin